MSLKLYLETNSPGINPFLTGKLVIFMKYSQEIIIVVRQSGQTCDYKCGKNATTK